MEEKMIELLTMINNNLSILIDEIKMLSKKTEDNMLAIKDLRDILVIERSDGEVKKTYTLPQLILRLNNNFSLIYEDETGEEQELNITELIDEMLNQLDQISTYAGGCYQILSEFKTAYDQLVSEYIKKQQEGGFNV